MLAHRTKLNIHRIKMGACMKAFRRRVPKQSSRAAELIDLQCLVLSKQNQTNLHVKHMKCFEQLFCWFKLLTRSTEYPRIGYIFALAAPLLIRRPCQIQPIQITAIESSKERLKGLHCFFDHSLLLGRVVLPFLEVEHHPQKKNATITHLLWPKFKANPEAQVYLGFLHQNANCIFVRLLQSNRFH